MVTAAAQLLLGALAQTADAAQQAPAQASMPWWWAAAGGVNVLTAAAGLWFIATYKSELDRVIKIVAPNDDKLSLGNRMAKVESLLYGDEHTDPGMVVRLRGVEDGLTKDRTDFSIFTERLENILTRLEEKIDRLACSTGEHDLVPPEPPSKPLPRVATNPGQRIDVSKLRKP